jgi:hypothetical protein
MAKKSLEARIERLEAVHEIQNVMGRYSYYHSAGMQEETIALWAEKTPGIRIDVPSFGYYEGYKGVRRCYVGAHNYHEGDRIGQMHMHTLTTPVIEIAGDGKTAKGVWISPGQETTVVDGKAQAYWAWLKYGADFVKEDGAWKLWHMRVFGIFFTPYEKSWTEANRSGEGGGMKLPDEFKPDKVTNYWTQYTPDKAPVLVPVPPQPYETWDEATAYVEKM